MRKLTILTILLFQILNAYSQIFEDMEIDESMISDWKASDINEYEGVYFFGISEGESQVTVSIENNIVCVQIHDFNWVTLENGHTDPRPNFRNFTNCKIVGNLFYSDEFNGKFVIFKKDDNQIIKALKINNYGSEKKYEIGGQGKDELKKYFDGKYIKTKFEIISTTELNNYSLTELQIMRNEIFARYHYRFKNGGKMDDYFRTMEWYSPLFDNVDNWLTLIEKENIKNIKSVESTKNNP